MENPSQSSESNTAVPARFLWKPELPARVHLAEVATMADVTLPHEQTSDIPDVESDRLCLGLADVQSHQGWASVWYSPANDGHLLVTGLARSGRTVAMILLAKQQHAYAAGSAVWIDDAVALWDELDERSMAYSSAHSSRGATSRVVFVDGLERVLGSLSSEARDALTQRLMHALRETGARRFVISCDAEGSESLRLGPLCAARLQLAGAHAGRARWGDFTMQVALPGTSWATSVPKARSTSIDLSQAKTCLVITNTRANSAERLRDALEAHGVQVLDRATPDEWMLRHLEFVTLSRDHAVVVSADVGLAESRMLLRAFQPLPPIPAGGALMMHPDGRYQRLSLESESGSESESESESEKT